MFFTIKLVLHLNCVLILTELFEIELTFCIKIDMALNNQQRLICHKTQPTNIFLGRARLTIIPQPLKALYLQFYAGEFIMNNNKILHIKTYQRMHRGGAEKNLKQKLQIKTKSPVWLPTHLPSKNWNAGCFSGLRNESNSPYVGGGAMRLEQNEISGERHKPEQ